MPNPRPKCLGLSTEGLGRSPGPGSPPVPARVTRSVVRVSDHPVWGPEELVFGIPDPASAFHVKRRSPRVDLGCQLDAADAKELVSRTVFLSVFAEDMPVKATQRLVYP